MLEISITFQCKFLSIEYYAYLKSTNIKCISLLHSWCFFAILRIVCVWSIVLSIFFILYIPIFLCSFQLLLGFLFLYIGHKIVVFYSFGLVSVLSIFTIILCMLSMICLFPFFSNSVITLSFFGDLLFLSELISLHISSLVVSAILGLKIYIMFSPSQEFYQVCLRGFRNSF